MPKTTTITQALAELKTLTKRIETKAAFITEHLMRTEALKDPLARQGGAEKLIAEERQAMRDLWDQQVRIRRAVEDANIANTITVGGQTRSMAEWLIWRREVSKEERQFLRNLFTSITLQRRQQQSKGASVVSAGQEAKPIDIVVNLNEKALADEIEKLEEILGTLDGELSLKNSTLSVSY